MTAAAHAGAAEWMAPAWTSGAAPPARPEPPTASSDDALVAAAAADAPLAFARLVERRQRALRAFLRRLCGDWALADDLAQETFLAAWSNLGRLRQGADVPAWLFGIAYNKYLGARRGARRARARERLWADDVAESPAFAPEDRLTLKAAMAELPVEQRACVALCVAAGYSHSQAAGALALPVGTVKSHVARGKARLLASLRESP